VAAGDIALMTFSNLSFNKQHNKQKFFLIKLCTLFITRVKNIYLSGTSLREYKIEGL